MNGEENIVRALKPPRCPKCGAVLEYLESTIVGIVRACFDGDDYYDWSLMDDDEIIYSCPRCGEVLFTDEYDARWFLLGEDD